MSFFSLIKDNAAKLFNYQNLGPLECEPEIISAYTLQKYENLKLKNLKIYEKSIQKFSQPIWVYLELDENLQDDRFLIPHA